MSWQRSAIKEVGKWLDPKSTFLIIILQIWNRNFYLNFYIQFSFVIFVNVIAYNSVVEFSSLSESEFFDSVELELVDDSYSNDAFVDVLNDEENVEVSDEVE